MEQAAKRTLGPLTTWGIGGGGAIVLAAFAIHRNYPKAVVFVLFAAGMAALAYGALVYFKSAKSAIAFDARPLLGQTLRGQITSGVNVVPEEVLVTMRCVHEWTEFGGPTSLVGLLMSSSRSRRYSRRQHETVWEASVTVPRKFLRGSPSGFTVPFQFELPQNGHRSGYEMDDLYRWEIEVRAAIPGVDFHTLFAVKVSR